jgi:hypothetical protein
MSFENSGPKQAGRFQKSVSRSLVEASRDELLVDPASSGVLLFKTLVA